MDFGSLDQLRQADFSGFVSIAELRDSDCEAIPREPGVYLVTRENSSSHGFLPESVGGHFKGKNPTVSGAMLQQNWVPGTVVLYIGQAGAGSSREALRTRITTLLQFGEGQPVGHWGGRLLWQLADAPELVVCWSCTAPKDPRDVKRALLEDFKLEFDCLPFANLRM
jgi:hypothetical protein